MEIQVPEAETLTERKRGDEHYNFILDDGESVRPIHVGHSDDFHSSCW